MISGRSKRRGFLRRVLPLFPVLFVVSCQEDRPTAPGTIEPKTIEGYPTVLRTIPADSLEGLRAAFAAANPRVCSSLDEFGFTSGICASGGRGAPPAGDFPRLVQLAKEAIVRNGEYTGVRDLSGLTMESTAGLLPALRIQFANQTVRGLEVLRTGLIVMADELGVLSVSGHHYRDIVVPEVPPVSARAAERSLLGLEITWYDFGGSPRVFTVTDASLGREPQRVILPAERSGVIELRVAWRVEVGMPGPGWWVYVDSVTMERLEVWQLFFT